MQQRATMQQPCAGSSSSSTQGSHRAPSTCSNAAKISSRRQANVLDIAKLPAEGNLPKQEQRRRAALHSSEVLLITLNPDWISKNFQKRNFRGKAELELCRRKCRKLTSRFWDIMGNRTCNCMRETLILTENRVWVLIGFQFNPVHQLGQITPDQSNKVPKTIWNWNPAERADQKGEGTQE